MIIKLLKKASWGGQNHKAGGVHDVHGDIADKLIARGYAEEYDPAKEVKDDDQPE